MRNQLKIGDKIGVLNPKNGRYIWSTITGMQDGDLLMLGFTRIGRYRKIRNEWRVTAATVIGWLKAPSVDFKDGRPLMKHRSVKGNYVTV
jgi:hypothetical protein